MKLRSRLPQVLLAALVGGVVLLSTNQTAAAPRPDDRIAYESGWAQADDLALFTANRDGGDRVRLSPAFFAFDGQPSYSPDGSRIALHSVRNFHNPQLWIINSDGTNARQITSNDHSDASPSWSPDGTRLVFDSHRPGQTDIFVINIDGTNEQRLTTSSRGDEFPAWSPDGSKIAFQSNRDGDWEIYHMNPDGTDVTQLTDNNRDDIKPDWSPSGNQIAFAAGVPGGLDVFVMDADGSNEEQLTDASGDDTDPDWSPDGSAIAFSSRRDDGDSDIWMMAADGDDQSRLFGRSEDEDYPDWSPRLCTVAMVIDGDTFACTDGTTVDMLQIDAPEQGQCGGQWAADALRNIFLPPGRQIALSFDETTESGGTALAAPLALGTDGTVYNLSIVMAYVGLARASTVGGNTKHQAWTAASQTWASAAQWNMWAPGAPFAGGC